MTDEPTQALTRFAAELTWDDIPDATREYCKDLLLDSLACALAGHSGEETGQLAALAGALAQSRESSVIGGGHLSLAGATLLNGYLITAVTMNDVHRPTMTHVTPEVVPPALAIAERDGKTGRDLLVAMAAGIEVMTRVGVGIDYPVFRAKGWHGPGVFGPFGAAAAVGRLLGLGPETMARAFGLAGSQSAGTFAAWGTPTVKFHQCRGALSGLMAALLAQQGFVATPAFLTAADGGLFNAYAAGGNPAAAIADLGQRWELDQVALRQWPASSALQGLATALFDVVEHNDVPWPSVRQVRLGLSPAVFDLHGVFARYDGKFEAMLSAHYTAAVILRERALTLAQFEPVQTEDPVLRRFAVDQVEVRAEPALSGAQAMVEVELQDGRALSSRCDHARGAPENRLNRGQIADKFRTYAGKRLPHGRIEEVIKAITALEQMESVRELMDVLRND